MDLTGCEKKGWLFQKTVNDRGDFNGSYYNGHAAAFDTWPELLMYIREVLVVRVIEDYGLSNCLHH